MQMKQRGSFAITTVILCTAVTYPAGVSKTRIMQEAMLNHNRVNRYCSMLVSTGLLGYDQDTRLFRITPKGKELLRLSEEAATFIAPIEKMISKYRDIDFLDLQVLEH